MCINKDCKEYVTCPSPENMSRVASFSPIRSRAMKNFESQIFADSKAKKPEAQVTSVHTSNPESEKHETNVKAQVRKLLTDNKALPTHQSHTTSTALTHLYP